ncbi:globin domain-containing protein [Streptomyces sp. NPDC059740]|uniref:globin domain-containing protein n=1 Tax=Streptomyces sp. NPDC059740 TaxID=3346926 RepID=UPI003649ABC7
MDAPTTTAAGNGSSGGDSGDWGWFTRAKKSREEQDADPARPDEAAAAGPERPVSPIRPVGTAAERGAAGAAAAGSAAEGRARGDQGPQPEQERHGVSREPEPDHRGHRTSSPLRGQEPVTGEGAGWYRPEPPHPTASHSSAAARHPAAPHPAEDEVQAPTREPAPTPTPTRGPWTPPAPATSVFEPAAQRPGAPAEEPAGPAHHAAGPAHHSAGPAYGSMPSAPRHPDSSEVGHAPRERSTQEAAAPVSSWFSAPAEPRRAAEGDRPVPGPGADGQPGRQDSGAASRSAEEAHLARASSDVFVPPHRRPAADAPGAPRRAEAPAADRPAAPPEPTHPLPATGPAAESSSVAGPTDEGSPDAILIRRTLEEVEPIADKLTAYFYALLFVRHPHLRDLFPASMDTQRDRLFSALLTAARKVDDTDRLNEYLTHLGRGHRKYGTLPEHYPAVGECLLAALSRYAPHTWGEEAEAAWVRAYTEISQTMIDAAAEDEAFAPAYWEAEVVSHELRTPDIAVVTVRPDQPYPFQAGQYTSLETPWWPKVWRHYSFAAAPRSDGLLSFHVKAIPAGWVSNALVHRARAGDVVRLGAPAGTMTVDHTRDNGLLCLGGGTGIAPIKALVEDVAEHGRRRPVDVFYGARSDHDLYDIDTMLRLAQTHPWLQVRPVVLQTPVADVLDSVVGQLPEAVRRYGPWSGYDGYLSGPPGMIRSGVEALVGAGIPTARIRHDSLDELIAAGAPPTADL